MTWWHPQLGLLGFLGVFPLFLQGQMNTPGSSGLYGNLSAHTTSVAVLSLQRHMRHCQTIEVRGGFPPRPVLVWNVC